MCYVHRLFFRFLSAISRTFISSEKQHIVLTYFYNMLELIKSKKKHDLQMLIHVVYFRHISHVGFLPKCRMLFKLLLNCCSVAVWGMSRAIFTLIVTSF